MEPAIAASSLGLGAMLSIPGKLESLLSRPELGLHKEERNKLRVLVGDVQELMDKYLLELSEVEAPAFTANCWVKEVRELSYDIDDFVDELVHAGVVPRSKASRLQEKRRRRRRWIADEISGFRTRVKEAIQRYKRYLGSCEMRPARCSDGSPPPPPPPPAPLDGGEACRLVGMNRSSTEELCGWLADDGQPGRKVVTIVGFGGVGKTTLAKQLYRKFGWQFECVAFVRTSRKPDMRRLLTSIFLQVRRLRHQSPHALGAHDLVDEIKAYLKDKKYFIIIDDLWASSTWDIVNRALPKGNCCSRILTTTEVDFVAQTCCADNSKYIFRMEPLSEDESMELFFSRIFGHQSECPQHLKEVSYEIIKRSGGLPLAVISTASLLAHQPTSVEQWNCIKNSLSSDLEGIEQVLSLGYNNLPHRLKACMLHLSLYEEDFIILKYDLANQWIDEGLICTMEGNDKEEVARSYFDELVNRGMIQPVDIGYNDEVLSCTVHYIILDFIKYKSIEENFITAIDHSQTAIRLADKVRRLSLHFGNAEDATTPANLRLQQVRTLAFFGLFNCKPSIVEFKLLQVLILQLSVDHDDINYDLTEISELFRLRYLYVNACHLHVNLPVQMQRLKDLATLKIEAIVSAVPSDIVDLPSLLHLLLPSEAKLPHGIDHMTSLRTLGHFDLSSNSIDNMMDLRDLTNLQDLHLTCSTVQSNELRNNMKCLGSILAKLRNLKSLTLVPADSPHVSTRDDDDASSTSISFDGFSSVSSPPAVLQRFELSRRCCILPRLPEWTKELANLCILKIAVGELLRHDILGGLPALTALSLYIQTAPKERIIFGRAGFLVLRYFKFRCSVPWLKFEADAMPKLRKLKLGFNAHRFDQHGSKPISIERLSGLKEIYAKIGGSGADAESALTTVVNNDPSNPRINVQLVDRVLYGDASTSMWAMWNSKKKQSTRAIDEGNMSLEQQDSILEEGVDESYITQGEDRGIKDEKKHADDYRISAILESVSSHSPALRRRRPSWRCFGTPHRLLPACCGVSPTSKSTAEGRDHLLWWADRVSCHAGKLSVAVVQANNLLEDQCHIESSWHLGTFIGIFDGHGGPEAARFASDHLFNHLQMNTSSRQVVMADAIRKAFKSTEEGFIKLVSSQWESKPQIAAVGSCCLVGIVHQKMLFVANLGSSRAVLGKVFGTGQIAAEQLSSEHIASDVRVRRELMAEHPDDPHIVVLKHNVWRVKGLIQVSRSIGDAYLKHPQYNKEPLQPKFRLSEPFSRPILSANPSIISRSLQPSDRFIIFASDGLWELLSNQEAVEIVHNHQHAGSARKLIKAALHEAAKKRGMRYSHITKIDKGVRRHFHDDITVVVLFIDYDLSVKRHKLGHPLSIRYPMI